MNDQNNTFYNKHIRRKKYTKRLGEFFLGLWDTAIEADQAYNIACIMIGITDVLEDVPPPPVEMFDRIKYLLKIQGCYIIREEIPVIKHHMRMYLGMPYPLDS